MKSSLLFKDWPFLVLTLIATVSSAQNDKTALEAKTQFAKIDNHTIAYRIVGEGSPILLCNRFRGVLDTWDPLFIDLLADNHQVIVFDYPGIGDSKGKLPTDIIELAGIIKNLGDYLKLNKVAVLGWSYGGLVAQAITLQHPDFVSHAILVGTNPPGENKVPLEPAFLERALKPINNEEDEVILFFEPTSKFSVAASKVSHQRIAQRLDVSKIPSTQDVFNLYFAGGAGFRKDTLGLREMLKNTHIPLFVIMGDHDISFAVENWFPFLRQIPSAQFLIYNKTGHAPQHEFPELTAKYINDFISLR